MTGGGQYNMLVVLRHFLLQLSPFKWPIGISSVIAATKIDLKVRYSAKHLEYFSIKSEQFSLDFVSC